MTTPAGAQPRPALSPAAASPAAAAAPSRVLTVSCLAHALHDGYTDMIYVLLPLWQTDFGLGYGALALLRGIYAGAMASLQIPAGRRARRWGSAATLALGTLLAAAGYGAAGASGSLLGLCVALAFSGAGSSTQHPLASSAVSRAYGRDARGPLGIYNFSGDLGKAALPALVSLLVTLMPWRHALWVMAALGCVMAVVIAWGLPRIAMPEAEPKASPHEAASGPEHGHRHGSSQGFKLLLMIGVLDTAVRMGLLTFLPFLLQAKGASTPQVGTALALVFIGGAAGKFACGWLGDRMGVVGTVLATEGSTAALIIVALHLPLAALWLLLPLLGVMLNGTSSVLYGTVPELSPPDRTERAFAVFYTGVIGAGAVAPVLYGLLGDGIGVNGATWATALTALVICPLALVLRPHLQAQPESLTPPSTAT